VTDRNVAVVGFAHAPHVRRTEGTTNGVEMLMPCFAELYAELGLKQTDIGFWCSGSADYLAGRAFSFLNAIDSIGAVPPINESHVEMDGAWALYEAYIKILTGAVDTALVYGFGKTSAGVLRRVLALQTDPYTVAPLMPDAVSTAGLQARFGLDSGKWTEEQMAQVALDAMAAGGRTDSVEPATSVDELLSRPYFADPLRRHDIAPITDGASAIVLASGDRARELRERPAWITGFEHRIETPVLGARDLTTSPSTVQPSAPDPDRGRRAQRIHEAQPLRWRTGRQPDVLHRLGADRLRGPAHLRRLGAAGPRARHQRGCPATESCRRDGG
jgi:acetyl-CoA acetyltransferase